MSIYGSLSIKRKLTLIATLTSSIALLMACLAFITYELVQYRQSIIREMSVLAEVIGNNSTAALIFEDHLVAEEILSALKTEEDIEAGCIYDERNDVFATFTREDVQLDFPGFESSGFNEFKRTRLRLLLPVMFDGEMIGKVFIQYNLREMNKRLIRYAGIVLGVFLFSVFISFVVIRFLQRSISGPILHLANVANLVSDNKDYTIRAHTENMDELGLLTDRFNEMLSQIQERDLALQQNQKELEERVKERTKELQQEIIEREKAEVEKEKIQAQLLQAQKMEAVGVLAGGIAHDFNNLLTGILGCTEMVILKNEISDHVYHDLKEIQVAVDRAANLTRQLLMFSRKQPMAFIPLNFNKVIEDLFKMLHRLIGEDIGINTHFDSRLRMVKADKGTIEQVLLNLTVNARDAMPDGGTFTIITENVSFDEKKCKGIPGSSPGEFVRISLEDTGVGMSAETIKRIFEPFYTTKGVGKGTGLGLSVVYGIVQQHNGWINVHSVVGEGTRFEIYLPAMNVLTVEEEEEVENPYDAYRGRGERILVIEDEDRVREFVERALTRYGYKIMTCATVADAERIIESEENFDLIFSDVVLPDGTGPELIKKLLIQHGLLRVVLTSGYTDHKSQWPMIHEMGIPFLHKPYVLIDLLKMIRKALDREAVRP